MRAYDGDEVCEIVRLFLLNNLAKKLTKIVLAYIVTMDLPYLKISMVIVQINYVKKSTNYLRKTDYL